MTEKLKFEEIDITPQVIDFTVKEPLPSEIRINIILQILANQNLEDLEVIASHFNEIAKRKIEEAAAK